jgi:thioesterase domain-containing protein
MAAHYVSEIREVQHEGIYLLAGYCFGGEVAYEMACQLHQAGKKVALLALIEATPAGQSVMPQPTFRQRELAKLNDFFQAGLRGKLAYVRRRARNAMVKIQQRLWFAAHDHYVHTGRPLPRRLQDVEAVNYRAVASYVAPQSPCRMTLLMAERDERDERLFQLWRGLALGGVEMHRIAVKGVDHLLVLKEPHVRAVAKTLTACIERACVEADVAGIGETT